MSNLTIWCVCVCVCVGARDGALMVWDSREAARWDGERRVGINSPVMVMEDAHKYVNTESTRKRRKQASHSCSYCPSWRAQVSLRMSVDANHCQALDHA